MRRLLTAFLLLFAVPMAACTTVPTIPVESPAPLTKTTIDDTALEVAWKAFDAALSGIDVWKSLKPEVKGTPKAIKIADAIDRTTAFLTAAEHAAAAGSTTDYLSALASAKAALADLRLAMQEK